MSAANRDSDLHVLGDPEGDAPALVSSSGTARAVAFVDSLVAHSPPLAGPPPTAPPALSPRERGDAAGAADAASSSIWLDGDVVMCACPGCGAPMSIRIWLLVADCWQCGTSIELTEEQEREVERLLDHRTRRRDRTPADPAPKPDRETRPTAIAAPVASTIPGDSSPPCVPTHHPANRPPQPAPVGKHYAPTPPPLAAPSGSRRPTLAQVRRPANLVARHRRVTRPESRGIGDWLGALPAWLVSFMFHLVMLLLLGLLTFDRPQPPLFLIISTAVSANPREGEFNIQVDPRDEVVFNLPLPDNIDLKDKKFREAMILADQQARELQLDPDVVAPQLPDLQRVKELAASNDPIRRSLAVRDPRLRVEVVTREGGTTLTEAAVARALRWLAKVQHNDGHWNLHGGGWAEAETVLALLPFLGAGQTHIEGRYKNTVAKGLRWLVQNQKENGDLRGPAGRMYGQGIAGIVLCDCYAMTGDASLREPAQKAINFIVDAQSADGGWRYAPREVPSDLSVVGWQLMALQSARMAGLKVPPESMESASHYLDSVAHDGGGQYGYMRGNAPKVTMTAEGLLCRMYLGWRKDDPGLMRGVDFLAQNHLPSKHSPSVYYWYYGTQVFHHFGGPPWEEWNRRMRDILVETQVESGDNAGSWDASLDDHGRAAGRIYVTALSTCVLEVYYRHAPIYRQLKLD